ncbi:DUF7346 family protein [Halopelagius longus]|uniref:HTH domain protein n=1 Tax=Halopelagius longus TaxID=1236180 RepID=A0A1H1C8W5_9EURY|nr:hypothetical protein [Halopelagius longus]SDQ60612.1 hypothetical protein SAMN05216278_2176 [Halopelagius longus]
MQTVRDDAGKRYLLVKRSGESSRVRDPETGTEQYRSNDELTFEGVSPLVTAAGAVPDSVRRVLSATHDDRSLGLLVEVTDRGPLSVVELLDAYDLCESDLHGLLGELRAADLLTETRVHGERGYDATETARDAVSRLRSTADGPGTTGDDGGRRRFDGETTEAKTTEAEREEE